MKILSVPPIITSSTLKKPASFRSVMNQGQKWVTPHFIVFTGNQSLVREKQSPKHSSDKHSTEHELLYGVVASKKVGNAVNRNRAKRRLRALIHSFASNYDLTGKCLVIVARAALLTAEFSQLENDLKWSLKRLGVEKINTDKP